METNKFDFDFDKDLKTANNIKDLQERLLFLKKRLKEFNQFYAGIFDTDFEDYGHCCNEEIKYVQELIKSKAPESKETPPPQKETEPIKWNNDVKELAYLFWKLRKENIIKNKTLGLTLSKLFIDKNIKEIKNSIFNKHFSDFENNNTFPDKAKEIDTFVNSIKEFHK